MDAIPEAAERPRQRAAVALRIIATGSNPAAADLHAAQTVGFRQLLIPPPWRGVVRCGRFLAADFVPTGAETLRGIADQAAAHGLDLLLDVPVDALAASATLLQSGRAPFLRPDPAAFLDPRRGVQADTAEASLDTPGKAEALAAWWAPVLRGWLREGAAGFRLLGLSAFPGDHAGAFITALRQALPEAVLLGWTPGMARDAIRALAGCGLDAVFSSLPYWDHAAPWLWDELADLLRIAPVVAATEKPILPDGAIEAGREELELEEVGAWTRSLALAAGIGQGVLAGPAVLANRAAAAILRATASAPALHSGYPPALPLGDEGPVLALLRTDAADHRAAKQAALLLVNTHPARSLAVAGASLLPAMGGVFGPLTPALTPADSIVLKAGEARLYTAEAVRPPGRRPGARPLQANPAAAEKAGQRHRLGIENPAPAVDGGAFPVKATAGELLSVEADIVFDGHEKIAAALRYRAAGEPNFSEIRMRPLGNDRWQAAFPLTQLGRFHYVVAAWRDRFETWRDEVAKKSAAGVDITLELIEGSRMLEEAAARGEAGKPLAPHLAHLAAAATPQAKLDILLDPELAASMAATDDRPFVVETAPIPVDAERIEARFASWYEVFPRSMSDDPNRHGTFRDVERHLPRIAGMGFDVLYFPPIHPIGRKNRKGPNNTLTPGPRDPGSPYAIGAPEGGHDALHPELGTLEDFAHLREAAAAHGLELAIDFAIQCSPDHPWLKQHPGWFDWRPDGSIRYAENPPKKYEDIVNVDFYAQDAVPGLWLALCDAVLFWAAQGVRLFRVDNPHTKPFPFWQWMIGEVRARYPDAIFLAEAFTRPKITYRLAKIGFSQSYTYFTWRNEKRELQEYLTELATEAPKDFFRPHFFVNTPDINPVFLQTSGRPGFLIRAALAATLSGLWGVYNGFELCEAAAIPKKEEYLDSEKYQVRAWDWGRPGNIVAEVTALNRIRKQNPALQTHRGVTFLPAYNDAVLYYEKSTPERNNVVLAAVSLDPHQAQTATIEIPLWRFRLPDDAALAVEDLLTGARFVWQGKYQQVTLTETNPYALWRVRPA